MNTNLALKQKPMTYEYQKPKKIKKTKGKPRKNRSIYSIITIGIIVMSSYFITHNFYVLLNSKDLYFAVEYNFTNNDNDADSLLRVKHMILINYDGNTATVEVSGLSKTKPHHTISLEGTFTKDDNKSWHVNEISQK